MEYLEGFPSLKLTYRRRTGVDVATTRRWTIWLCRFRLGQQLFPALHVRQPVSVQEVSDSLALQDAQDRGAVHSRSGVLLGVSRSGVLVGVDDAQLEDRGLSSTSTPFRLSSAPRFG